MNKIEKIDFAKIETKWQKRWAEEKVFEVREDSKKKKFYVLEMFPYPSANFLHMGHVRNYTIGDVIARFKRMKGFNVLYPMGYDSFGLPAENAAKKAGESPEKYTKFAIKKISGYFKQLGNSYDWSKMIASHEPEYYKWNQLFFLKFFEKGLVYRGKAKVNWCPSCNTVLANEEVEKELCWRCSSRVIDKELDQWFFKTTSYADELIKDLDKLKWSDKLKIMQKNWIGKSEGTEILFDINGAKWPVFTTRADTICGVTFLVVSAQHLRLMELVAKEQKKNVEKFLEKIKKAEIKEETNILEKEGVFTGSYAVNPINGKKVPVYAGNFVIADYGSGMVMAVPAHDPRDFEFAKKYKIPIRIVIQPEGQTRSNDDMGRAFTGFGKLVNSGEFNGIPNNEAIKKISEYLAKKKLGRKAVQYKLRDWLISRQRYWGTPIPVIYCEHCGIVPVPEKELPVKLPEDVRFKGTENPILSSKKFLNVKCPKCSCGARRETDTMGGFMDSSWYFLRFCDSKNSKKPFDKKKIDYWMPVDQYIGGIEHAVGHLIYSRFFTKALRDLGFISQNLDEPFSALFNQGVVYGEDGRKMSKSYGNVVVQEEIAKKYGIDSARLFLLFVAAPDSTMEWSSKGIEGVYKFIKRIFEIKSFVEADSRIEHYRNKFIRDISRDIDGFKFNLAIIKLMKWGGMLTDKCDKKSYEDFLKVLSVFAPHVCEEIWSKIGGKGFVSVASWPEVDENKIDEKLEEVERAVDKVVEDVVNVLKIVKDKEGIECDSVYLYVLPNEVEKFDEEMIGKRVGRKVKVFVVNDKNKYDPEGKAGKAKPGKPGIFVE